VAPGQLTRTIQNDVLKEYIARGTYILPAAPVRCAGRGHVRLLPSRAARWNTISISGYHMAEAGATPVPRGRVHAGQRQGVRPGRAGLGHGRRRLRPPALVLLRGQDHAARGGGEVPRRAAAVGAHHEGGVQGHRPPVADAAVPHPDGRRSAPPRSSRSEPESGSACRRSRRCSAGPSRLHTNSFDEALALPSTKAARLAIRTQQVIANESDLTATADPFAGSYAIESMTDDIEAPRKA